MKNEDKKKYNLILNIYKIFTQKNILSTLNSYIIYNINLFFTIIWVHLIKIVNIMI